MKRGGPEHPKVGRLARALEIKEYAAVGILECLFHWTSRYAPAGDIGRWGPSDVARGIGWDGDPERLMAALESAGWVDKHTACGSCVHGWSEHADDAVHMGLARARRRFADGSTPRLGRLSKDERTPLESFYATNPQQTHDTRTENALPTQAQPTHSLSHPQPTQALPDPRDTGGIGSAMGVGGRANPGSSGSGVVTVSQWLKDHGIGFVASRHIAKIERSIAALERDWEDSSGGSNRQPNVFVAKVYSRLGIHPKDPGIGSTVNGVLAKVGDQKALEAAQARTRQARGAP